MPKFYYPGANEMLDRLAAELNATSDVANLVRTSKITAKLQHGMSTLSVRDDDAAQLAVYRDHLVPCLAAAELQRELIRAEINRAAASVPGIPPVPL